MASGKEYTMLFQLSAQLGGNFSGTFSRAQQTISKMQSDIQALNRTQSDVSAYQKQQQAVEATKNKLAVLQQQYDNIQKEIQETGTFSSDLENKLLSKQQQIDKTNGKLQEQTDKLNQMGSALREAGVDTDHLTDESKRLETEMTELKKKQEDVADGADSFGERSAAAFAAVQQALVSAGITEGLKEIAEAYMECVNLAGDFEEAMSAVEAISGADAQGMAELSAMAKELGATTKFTAQQSAEAMSYMAMAGWDVNDMLGGMSGVLSLAAASGEDLAMVSDIVTDSLTAFGLSASDSGHFSDVLAAAAANANTNVSIMGETMKMSASVAGALGYSIEDVAVAMGLMANSGVKGSIAGTALRNTFNGLLSGVTLTGEAFGEYTFSAIRADGTMKGFASTIDELRGYFQQMTEAERVANAQAIAGQRGYNGLLAILNASDAEYQKLTASINGCSGAAERMASIRMDNMKGQLTLLQSAWEALRVTVGENFTGAMRGVYSVLTDVVTGFNQWLQQHPALVKGVAAFVGVLGAAVAALTAVATVTKVLIPLMGLLTASIPGLNIIVGLAALAGVIVGVSTAADQGVDSVQELTTAASAMNANMLESRQAFADAQAEISATASTADYYIDRLEAIEQETNGNVSGNREYHAILTALSQQIPEVAGMIDLETNSIEGGTAALRSHTEAWKRDAQEQAKQSYLNGLIEDYNNANNERYANEVKLVQEQAKLERATKEHSDALAKLNALAQDSKRFTSEGAMEQQQLQETISRTSGEMKSAEAEIANLNTAIETGTAAVANAEQALADAESAIDTMESGSSEAGQVIDQTFASLQKLAEAYDATYQAALESFEGQFGLFDQAQADADATVANAQAALDSQLAYWQNYAANIDVLRSTSAADLGITQENYDALMSYVRSGSEEAAGLAQSIVDNLNSGNTEAVANVATTIGEVQKAQQEAAAATAEWTTGLSEQTRQLVEDMTSQIEQLDVSDEAAAAARDTINSYISTAGSMSGAVQQAFANLAAAAISGINSGGGGGGSGGRGGRGGGNLRGKAAIGTQHANRGYYLVGEEGPEIVWMDGGEQVMNARETQRVQESMEAHRKMLESARQNMPEIDWINGGEQMRSALGLTDARETLPREITQIVTLNPALAAAMQEYGAARPMDAIGGNGVYSPITVHVEFRFEGNVTSEAVDRLEAYGDLFAERVRDVLDEYKDDMVRSGYR